MYHRCVVDERDDDDDDDDMSLFLSYLWISISDHLNLLVIISNLHFLTMNSIKYMDACMCTSRVWCLFICGLVYSLSSTHTVFLLCHHARVIIYTSMWYTLSTLLYCLSKYDILNTFVSVNKMLLMWRLVWLTLRI